MFGGGVLKLEGGGGEWVSRSGYLWIDKYLLWAEYELLMNPKNHELLS